MIARATGVARTLHLLCAAVLIVSASPRANAQEAAAGTVRTAVATAGETEIGELRLLVGRSALVNVGQAITRVSLTRPDIADAVVTGTQQILVHGKAAGVISMFVWDRAGGIKRYDVSVGRDLSELNEQFKQLFPGEQIAATGNGKTVVISGAVSSKYVMEKAAEVAAGYVEKKEDVVNLLKQQVGIATDQVLLRVRFAEVNRSALTELGLNLFSDGKNNTLGSSGTQQFPAPFFDQQQPMVGKNLVFSDYLNLFLFNSTHQIGLTIRALQSRGLLESLAEPNLIAENGKEASFLAGGEYPYPVVQGAAGALMATIVFKEYGIRLNFTPELRGGDLIHLKVRPEVSALDFANAVTYQGFRIPALSTRRADTEIELQDGQTFAIAGLLSNTVASTLQKMPGIGDIPILGYLFRSKAAQKAQTELVVMITPEIVKRGAKGAATGLPSLAEPFLPTPQKTVPPPPARLPGAPQLEASSAVAAPATPVAAAPPAQQASHAPAAVAPTPAELKKLAAEKKAAEKAAQKAAAAKAEEDRKAAARAAEEQKKQQAELKKKQAAEAAAADVRKKLEAKKAEEQRKVEARKAQEELKAEQQRLEAAKKQAAEARKDEERLLKERAERDALLAREQAESRKKMTYAEQKRLKEIQDAQERLRVAQAAYDAALERAKKAGSL